MASVFILAVGQDPMVLNSRCSILRSAGYFVRQAFSIVDSVDLFRNDDFDLLLLCHSIPVLDRDRLISAIRSTGTRIPIYVVASAECDFRAGLADGVLSSRPDDLIKELGAVLAAAQRGAARIGRRVHALS